MANQILAKAESEIASPIAVGSTQSPPTEISLGHVAANIVADAKTSPATYLRRCVTGHDGE